MWHKLELMDLKSKETKSQIHREGEVLGDVWEGVNIVKAHCTKISKK